MPPSPMPGQTGVAERAPIPGVKNLVAVASGKGGVGKTTVAVNLAVALNRMGASVGLLDADVYGPNVPLMLNTSEQPQAIDERRILPVEAYGLKMISMGLLNPGDRPMIWRGPMLHSVIQQFLRSVQWGQLETDPQIRIGGDSGKPVAARGESASVAKSIYAMARAVAAQVAAVPRAGAGPAVQID